MPLVRRQIFHDVGQIGGMHIFEFLVRDAQFHTAKRVGFNQVDEFPRDHAGGKLGGNSPDEARRGDSLEQAAGRAREAHVHMCHAQFDGSVGLLLGNVNVIYTNDFSAAGVDDLLVEQVFTHGQPTLIWLVVLELLLLDVQLEHTGCDKG